MARRRRVEEDDMKTKYDPMLLDLSTEMGITVEAVTGVIADRAQDLVLLGLQKVAARREARSAQEAEPRVSPLVDLMGRAVFAGPKLAGRFVATSSYVFMRLGVSLMQEAKEAARRAR
jgi:hypothetical protein